MSVVPRGRSDGGPGHLRRGRSYRETVVENHKKNQGRDDGYRDMKRERGGSTESSSGGFSVWKQRIAGSKDEES